MVNFFFFFNLNFAPNLLNGSDTLLKSLFDKLLSPISLIGCLQLINSPKINLPSVPEFSAFIMSFYNYNHQILFHKFYIHFF